MTATQTPTPALTEVGGRAGVGVPGPTSLDRALARVGSGFPSVGAVLWSGLVTS